MKNNIKKIAIIAVCGLVFASIFFFLGTVYQFHRVKNESASNLYSDMHSLRNSVIMMTSIINRPDYDMSASDKSHFPGVSEGSADVYLRLRSLAIENNEYIFREDELKLSRPSVDYILNLTRQILLSDFEDYPRIYEEALPLIESYSSDGLWDWLNSLDSELQSTPTLQ